MAGTAGFGVSSPTLAWGSLIAQGIGNTITALGSLSTTRYQNKIQQSQANIARINASIAMTNAQTMERRYQAALNNNESAVVRQTMQAATVKHSQRAAAAANGVAVGVGSAAEQQASTDLIKEMDRNALIRNGTSEAWGYRWQKLNYENEARGLEGKARAAESMKQSPLLNFGISLLGGAQQTGFSYLKYYNAGLFGKSASSSPAIQVDAVSGASPDLHSNY